MELPRFFFASFETVFQCTHVGPASGLVGNAVEVLLHAPEGAHEGADADPAHHVDRDARLLDRLHPRLRA